MDLYSIDEWVVNMVQWMNGCITGRIKWWIDGLG